MRSKFTGKTFRTITVQELRDALEFLPDDGLVVFTADYGDISHTPQALAIEGEIVEGVRLTESGYSHSGWAVIEDEDYGAYDEDEDDLPRFILIR